MYKFLGLVLVLLCSSIALARPSAYFSYALNSQGEPQLKVRGVDLCDPYGEATFRIRVTDDLTGDSGWYTSERGNTQWPVNKNACTVNMFLARKYLLPGKTLELRTYAGSGRRMHSFSVTIPCEESRWVAAFSDSVVYETEVARPISCGGQQQPPVYQPPQQPPQQPTLSCNASVGTDSRNPNVAKAYVNCNQNTGAAVSVFGPQGSLLCENQRFFATTLDGEVCSFNRDRSHRLDYKIKVYAADSGALIGSTEGTVVKDATYFYPPQGTLVSDRFVQPVTQNKALGRGQYWDVSVKALVADGDVDPSENQRLIKVELIEVINGGEKVIKSDMANSGQTVQFSLEHEYVVPKLIGKPHESGDLHRGSNTLKVRVWDAYQGNVHVDLPEVTVVIPQ
jgi:hypothetical protein